jgi:hypothetical protein
MLPFQDDRVYQDFMPRIELNDGSYTMRIQQDCNLFSDAINAT